VIIPVKPNLTITELSSTSGQLVRTRLWQQLQQFTQVTARELCSTERITEIKTTSRFHI